MATVPQTLSLSKGWEAFELAARVEGRSRKTLAAYRYVLGSFQRWLGERELCHVDATLLRAYITHLQERLRPASVHHHFRGLQSGPGVEFSLESILPSNNFRDLSEPHRSTATG